MAEKKQSKRKPYNREPGYVFSRKFQDGHIVCYIASEQGINVANKYVLVIENPYSRIIGDSHPSISKARQHVKRIMREGLAFGGVEIPREPTQDLKISVATVDDIMNNIGKRPKGATEGEYSEYYKKLAGYEFHFPLQGGHVVCYEAEKQKWETDDKYILLWEHEDFCCPGPCFPTAAAAVHEAELIWRGVRAADWISADYRVKKSATEQVMSAKEHFESFAGYEFHHHWKDDIYFVCLFADKQGIDAMYDYVVIVETFPQDKSCIGPSFHTPSMAQSTVEQTLRNMSNGEPIPYWMEKVFGEKKVQDNLSRIKSETIEPGEYNFIDIEVDKFSWTVRVGCFPGQDEISHTFFDEEGDSVFCVTLPERLPPHLEMTIFEYMVQIRLRGRKEGIQTGELRKQIEIQKVLGVF